MTRFILTLFLALIVISGYSQSASDLILEGNKAYRKGDYKKAESLYRKSVEKNSEYDFQGRYNLANSLFMLKDYEGARNMYASLLQKNTDKITQNKLYHNIGNTYLMEKKYQESIAAYKNALKNNPNDEDARYNLSYALKKMQQQNQNNKNNKDQNKDQNKNEDRDNQQPEQNKDEQQDNQQAGNDNRQQDEQQQQQQDQQAIPKEDAERLLNAIANDEREVQEKVKREKAAKARVRTLKNW